MIYEVIWTSRFKKSYKLCKKRGLPLEELKSVVELLRTDQTLDEKFRDHLLCYRKNNGILTLTLVDTGTHSDLFGK